MTTMHMDTFLGFTRRKVSELIGTERARQVLWDLEHNELTHGRDWKWIGGDELFTPAGIERLVEGLNVAGEYGAALALSAELERAKKAAEERPGESEISVHPAKKKSWTEGYENY